MPGKKYFNHYSGTDFRLLAFVKKKTRYTIDESKCIGCTNCIDVCPPIPKAIYESDILAVARYPEEVYAYAINQDRCTGCGRCSSVCPSEPDTIYRSPVRVSKSVGRGKETEEEIQSSPDVKIPGAKNLPKVPTYYTQ